MAEQTSATAQTSLWDRITRRARRISRRRFRRLLSILYVLLAVALTGALLLFIGLMVYRTPPSWVDNPRSYVIGQRLALSVVALVGLQLAAGWVLGLFSAVGGAMAASHQAALKPRLAIVRRRTRVLVAVMLILRIMLLGIVLLAAIYIFTDWLGPSIEAEAAQWERAVQNFPLLPALGAGLLLVHLFAGPFLRRRYSVRLGALAATLKRRRIDRMWMAINLRLGAGLAGLMSALWGLSVAMLPLLLFTEPSYSPRTYVRPPLLPDLSSRTAEVLFASGAVAVGIALFTVGQIVLPWLFRLIAARRLAKPLQPAGRQMPASVRRREESL